MNIKNDLDVRLELAQRELGKSIIKMNPFIQKDIREKDSDVLCFGIKNTIQVPYDIFEKLRWNKKFLWLTVDKMADKGRSMDTDLINPLTYRVMTGSTSGGAINILKGINDLAIGTDGGGSVLAPAMSCMLPSMIGSGLDLFVDKESLSTDSIKLRGSIGVIAKKLDMIIQVFEEMLGKSLRSKGIDEKELIIAVPKQGTVKTPDNKDMTEKLSPYIELLSEMNCKFIYIDFSNCHERQTALEKIKESFVKHHADIILTYEGPIDVYGYGETIPEQFGDIGKHITENNGKFLLRAANIYKTTAITIPSKDMASGLLVIADHGYENAMKAVKVAGYLEAAIKLPDVWTRYYLTNERFNKGFEFQE